MEISQTQPFLSRLRERYGQIALMKPRLKGPRAYANWLRSNCELLAGASRIQARPIKLTFDPTNVCQLRCPLCPTGLQTQDREAGHAALHMFQHLLEQVGDYVFFIDFFNWGEPLLNTRVEEFVQLASSRNIVSSISSNLSLPMTDERIRRIVTSGLNEIIVSLDGASSETYATYRKRGKFELVYDNMQRIIQTKRQLGRTLPIVTWQFLVFRFNEHEIDKAKAMAAEMGVDRLIFRPPSLDVDRYPLRETEKETMAGWKPSNSLYQISAAIDDSKPKSRCGWHYMSTAINWDGAVAPCCTLFEKRDDFGSIGKGGEIPYMDVVNNPAFQSFRERFAERRKTPFAMVYERCPTPQIMDYHKWLNRQITLFTLVTVVEAVRGFFGGSRSRQPESGTLPAASPIPKQ
jgi:MoaA/NifB/PqqE/SkfB family radical SAM enzyme